MAKQVFNKIINSGSFRLYTVFVLVVFVMINLNALVDIVFHPEIPYFDEEHLIVGGFSGLVTGVGFGILIIYINNLKKAYNKIKTLERLLYICANCKHIQRMGTNPEEEESWIPIEQYITENTGSLFSHGICPKCRKELYSDINF